MRSLEIDNLLERARAWAELARAADATTPRRDCLKIARRLTRYALVTAGRETPVISGPGERPRAAQKAGG